jgi:hypothetical protein
VFPAAGAVIRQARGLRLRKQRRIANFILHLGAFRAKT